uniref:EB domain-containing protein n=1 Tax=Angiostrongylus cantonensis TaxID=6313 RepID=A0A0K0D5G5_ANGCA
MAEMVMVKPGIKCGVEQICSGGARCIDGVCKCPRGEVSDVNNKCVRKSQVYAVFNKLPTFTEKTLSYNPYPTMGFYPNPVVFTSTSQNLLIQADKMKESKIFEASLKANPNALESGKDQGVYTHNCKANEDCPVNAFCFQQLCRCLIGYQANENYCEPISEGCMSSAVSSRKPCAEVAYPGMECTSGEICSYNSYCNLVSGVCECPNGMATINNQCERTTSTPGLACVTSRNCHRSSYCDNGLCLCKVGYELLNNFCVPIAGIPTGSMENVVEFDLKKPKSQDLQSFPKTSEQYATAILQLDLTKPPFYYPTKFELKSIYANSSLKKPPPSLFSHPSTHSDNFGSFPIPFAKGASTKSGDVISELIKAPLKLKVSLPGDFCGDNSICIANSICQNQFCRCPHNTFAENGICTLKGRMSLSARHNDERFISQEDANEDRQFASPLENCQNFEFCTGGAECSSIQGMGLVCQCPMNTVLLEGECVDAPRNVNLAGIGETCQNGEICLGGSRCVQNICMCEENRRDVLGICVRTVRPGDDCSDGQICVDGSVCAASLKICVCPPGRSSKLGRCVENENFPDFHRPPGPGTTCGPHSICNDNSFCSGGVCVCKATFEILDGRCVSSDMIRHPGDECFSKHVCRAGSECRDQICTCPNGQFLIEGKCVRVTNEVRRSPTNQECNTDADCTEHYQCVDRLCVCHGTLTHCLQIMFVGDGISCSDDSHCPEHGICIESVCVCNDGYENSDGICRPHELHRENNIIAGSKNLNDLGFVSVTSSGPGASCSETKICVMGSLCLNGYCVCDFDSISMNGVCVSRMKNLGPNERCSNRKKCRDGLTCLLGRCVCYQADVSCDGVFS